MVRVAFDVLRLHEFDIYDLKSNRMADIGRTRNRGSPSLPLVASGSILRPERFIQPRRS